MEIISKLLELYYAFVLMFPFEESLNLAAAAMKV